MACLRCGQCCLQPSFTLQDVGDDPLEFGKWYELYGCEVRKASVGEHNVLTVLLPLKCKHLVMRDGQYGCGSYDDRPRICSDYLCPRARDDAPVGPATEESRPHPV